ncbi:MAG: hypothetical protein JXA08_00685 [Methanomicrobiaceae archaeon]|nr:hypothetical protein [Methanomicrobiaceae archaeon]
MASLFDALTGSIVGWLELARTAIAAGGDPEEELALACRDIKALCDETDQLYCAAVTSMW